MIRFTLKETPSVPLEAEVLSPDALVSLAADQIRALPVLLGKRRRRLDEFFEVEGDGGDEIEIRGDAQRVKWIGRGMTRGTLRIDGNAGMHLGSAMSGGTIEVSGDVGDWLGAEMTGGVIRVHGNAGGQVGAAYRGGLSGMRDGLILIDGAAGLELGMRMKRGTIVVEEGDVKEVTEGREFIVHPECDPQIENYIRPLFEKVYTMSFANYAVEMERLRDPEVMPCK